MEQLAASRVSLSFGTIRQELSARDRNSVVCSAGSRAWRRMVRGIAPSTQFSTKFRGRLPQGVIGRPLFSRRPTSAWIIINAILFVVFAVQCSKNDNFVAGELVDDNDFVGDWPGIEYSITNYTPRSAFDIISERPLFVPSRRPSNPVLQEARDIEIELMGTYLSDSGRRALVWLEAENGAVWLKQGDYIEAWQIEEIHAGWVRLRRMDEKRVVHLWPGS